MKKISIGCIIIGVISIMLSIIGIFLPLNGFIGCNLPFQFLLLLSSWNKNYFLVKFIQSPFLDYIFSIILITSGIGTIWGKSWGRAFAYIYAISIILLSVVRMPVAFGAHIIQELIRTSKESSFMDWIIWGQGLAYIFTLVGALLYPIFLLIFFSRPKIKEKFSIKR